MRRDVFHSLLFRLLAAVVASLWICGWSGAQEGAAGGGTDEEAPPTLDELLGIEDGEAERRAAEIAEEKAEQELRRRLSPAEIDEALTGVLDNMALSARLLDEEFDTGMGTQRVQREILAGLDRLLEESRRQCSGGRGAPGGRRSSSEQEPGKRGGECSGGESTASGAEPSSRGGGPAFQEGAAAVVIEETRSEWGQLPRRVREMLVQGRSERFSALYEKLTEAYYRRLAEEGSSR